MNIQFKCIECGSKDWFSISWYQKKCNNCGCMMNLKRKAKQTFGEQMMNRKDILDGEWDNVCIDKKNEKDTRDGDFWVNISTDGCGCCSESYFELHSKEYSKKVLEEWIKIKEKELTELKSQLQTFEV